MLVVCVSTSLFGRLSENQALHEKHARTWWKQTGMQET